MLIKWSMGMAKEWEKWIDKVCGNFLCKTKVYKFVENLIQKYVDNWVKGVVEKSC